MGARGEDGPRSKNARGLHTTPCHTSVNSIQPNFTQAKWIVNRNDSSLSSDSPVPLLLYLDMIAFENWGICICDASARPRPTFLLHHVWCLIHFLFCFPRFVITMVLQMGVLQFFDEAPVRGDVILFDTPPPSSYVQLMHRRSKYFLSKYTDDH